MLIRCRLLACVLALFPGSCTAQVSPAKDVLVLDPAGRLAITADGERFELRFPQLVWPAAGEHRLATTDGAIVFGKVDDQGFHAVEATVLVVRAFGPERIDGEVTWTAVSGDRHLALEGVPALRPIEAATVTGRPAQIECGTPGIAAPEDFVVCAIGSPGSGLPGQRQVAASIARLSEESSPDLILIVGDLFLPDGVQGRDDRLFIDRFESVYPASRFPVPFRIVPGAAENRGKLAALTQFCATSPRLRFDWGLGVSDEDAGGSPVEFLFCDSPLSAHSIARDAGARRVRSMFVRALAVPAAGWRVVATYDVMHGHGDAFDSAASKELRRVHGPTVERSPVDLWLSGASHSLELVRDAAGTLHIGCGGGAGPEFARSVAWQDDTLFAATGGGSVWLRFHGERCEISLRDSDGQLLWVHQETRRTR